MKLGKVIFVGFNGAGGYTVTIENGNFAFSYCHVSPNFLVYVGEYVYKGQVIANVGPKNVYNVPNNTYKDSDGNPTNRSYYWSSSSFCNKKRRQSRQSFRLSVILTYLHRHCFREGYILSSFCCILLVLFHLPNLIQLYYYIQDILFLLLIHHSLL